MTRTLTVEHPAKGASRVSMFAGLWLFLTPWIYGMSGSAVSWNDRIVGALVVLFALTRVNRPRATQFSWFNSILGLWIFLSSWVYGSAVHPGRIENSLIVGIIVFCAGIAGANCERMSHDVDSGV